MEIKIRKRNNNRIKTTGYNIKRTVKILIIKIVKTVRKGKLRMDRTTDRTTMDRTTTDKTTMDKTTMDKTTTGRVDKPRPARVTHKTNRVIIKATMGKTEIPTLAPIRILIIISSINRRMATILVLMQSIQARPKLMAKTWVKTIIK